MSQMFPNFVLAGSNGIHVESQIPCIYLCIDLAIASNSLGTLLMRLSLGHPVRYQYMEDLLCLDTCCPTGVYKQWTGLLEWWNSGMVDWRVFVFVFIICHVVSTL